MAAEVYEDTLELTVPILEAVLPDSGQYLSSAYPYPSLRPTGRSEHRRFRAIVLENPFIRAVIVPELGGRILRLRDKRTGAEILPIEALAPTEGGLRGVEIPQGIQLRYTQQDRHNAMGSVNFQIDSPDDEEDEAGVWIGEIGVGLSFNALISVPPNAAELKIELRTFNRRLANTPYNGGLSIGLDDVKANVSTVHQVDEDFAFVCYSKKRDCGLAVFCGQPETAFARYRDDRLTIHRFGPRARFSLSPRQLDTWRFKVTPFSGLGGSPAAGQGLAAVVSPKTCRFQAHRRAANAKLLVLTKDNQSLEAPLDLWPEHPAEVNLDELPEKAKEIAVLIDGKVAIRHVLGSRFAPLDARRIDRDSEVAQESRAREAAFTNAVIKPGEVYGLLPATRYAALIAKASQQNSTESSAETIEQALLYNGEDHLAWIQKAAVQGLGNRDEEQPELLNAHFLAPLEPALRAAGFLGQPQALVKDASPILGPLEDAPEQFVEVACWLMDCGMLAEASRFIDEALRHEQMAMLHYLQAYALRIGTRMQMEAVRHVQAGSSLPFGPPFPWRAIELKAIKSLAGAFPEDERPQQYAQAAESHKSQDIMALT